jgi:hypothetical protein
MGIGAKLLSAFSGGDTVSKGMEIIDQLVEDKDAANQIKAAWYLAELNTKTIPIADAFHKLGRQFLAFAQLVFYGWCVSNDVPITWELVTGVSGVSGAYTLAKGKGK